MTKQPEALRIADVLIGSPQFTGTPIWQAADMLRRQHEAIVKLREALKELTTAGEEAWGTERPCVWIGLEALKDTEGLCKD